MYLNNPREKQFPWLQSYVTSDFIEPAQPRMIQTHSNRVVIVTDKNQIIGEADGMVTSLKNIELHVRVADCGNIYAYDPLATVIGVCHSGWKGSQGNIIATMIESMKILGSYPEDIRIRTGPCISWKNYEFWPEVKDLFEWEYYTTDRSLRGTKQSTNRLPRSVALRSQWQKYYLNLPKLHHDQLIASWVQDTHIIQSDICTFDTNNLPSYRRNGPDVGRITGSIMMR